VAISGVVVETNMPPEAVPPGKLPEEQMVGRRDFSSSCNIYGTNEYPMHPRILLHGSIHR
jgi:hypothetical protein